MTDSVVGLVVPSFGLAPSVVPLELPPIGPGQVRVRIRAAGVCHSDLSMVNGTIPAPHPLVLGHEAAGSVVEAGAGVTRVSVGDHVVLNWLPACRSCWFCSHGEPWLCASASGISALENGMTLNGEPVNVALGLGAFASEVVVPATAAIPVPPSLDFASAALLGCGVVTGFGAVRNTAGVSSGETVVVIGLGGVGLSVVAAARSAGASTVIAVDVSESKADLAIAAGATDFLLASDNLSREIRTRTSGVGADHAFECVGRAATIRAAWRATRRGGRVTVVGMGAQDDVLSLSALEIFSSSRTLKSSVYGSADPDVEVPLLAADVLSGSLSLNHLITDRIALDDVPAAFDAMSRGEGARSVVVLD